MSFTHSVSQRAVQVTAVVLAALIAFCCTTFARPESAYAVSLAQKQAEAAAALSQLQKLQYDLNKVSDVYFGALDARDKALKSMDDAQKKIEEDTKKIEELQTRIGSRCVAIYKNGGGGGMLEVLFGSTSFEDFINNWIYVSRMNESDANLVATTKAMREEVEQQKKQYEEAAKEAEKQAQSVEGAYQEAASLEAAARRTYNSLDAEVQSILAQQRAAQEAAERKASGASDPQTYKPASGNAIVDRAMSKLGCPYVWAASGPNSFDCSGLASYAYGYSGHAFTTSTLMKLPAVSNPQPGDVCVKDGHCGIYIGDGLMIHAPQTGDVVKISAVQSGMKYVRP